MKNITVTVPDEVYRNARIRAAERGTSVSALVAEYLRSLSWREAEFSRLEAQQQQVQREIRRFRARDILAARDVALSVQVLQEFYVQATRASRPDPLTHEQATGLVESFLRFPVLDITTELMLAAAATCHRFGVSYWDAAILEAARSLGCDAVLSEDLGDGQNYAGVRVENPFRSLLTSDDGR